MALMSTLYSPKAQWALGDATDLDTADRSGNAEDLTAFQANVRPAPDLLVGFVRPVNNSSGFIANKTGTYVRTLGALTILCRGYFTGTGSRRALAVFGAATAGEVSNTVFDLAVDASDLLTYRHMHGIKVEDAATSAITVDVGHERFFGLRRASDGLSVTFSYGDFDTITHETVAVANAPTGGTSSTLRLGGGHSSADTWLGGLFDMCIWHSELTDAQVEAFWEEAMQTGREATNCPPGTPTPTPVPGSPAVVSTTALLGAGGMPVPIPKFSDFRNVMSAGDLAKRAERVVRDIVLWAADQPRFHLRQLEIVGGALPVKLLVPGLTRPPLGVALLGCQAINDPTVSVDAGQPHWFWTTDGYVQINAISGLDSTTAYRLSLAIFSRSGAA